LIFAIDLIGRPIYMAIEKRVIWAVPKPYFHTNRIILEK